MAWTEEGWERAGVAAPAPPGEAAREGPVRILVVAKREAARLETVSLLEGAGVPGWLPDAVDSAAAAARALATRPWDAVVLRLDGGGLEPEPLLAVLAQSPWWPPTVVVAVLPPEPGPWPARLGPHAVCIPAPLAPRRLVEALRRALRRPGPPPERGSM